MRRYLRPVSFFGSDSDCLCAWLCLAEPSTLPTGATSASRRAAADAFRLDKVLFAPAGRQPLKTEATPASYADRLAMVKLACAEDARFSASEIDAPRADGAPNYTVDTLAALRESMPDAEIFSLIGADSLLGLPHWREPKRLLELAEWIVASRPGYPLGDLAALGFTALQRSRIHLLETVHYDVAATDLRRRLRGAIPARRCSRRRS